VHRLAGRRIFSLGEREFIWEDVVLAAHLWGDITALQRRTGQALAAQHRLAKSVEGVSEDDVEEAANAWRYDHDLISADDLEAWLSARALVVDEWLAYIRRTELVRRTSGRVTKPNAASSDQIDDVLLAEAMCSGTIAAVAEKLAGRAAVSERVTTERSSRAPAKAMIRSAVDRLPSAVRRGGLFDLSGAETVARAGTIAAMDAIYARFVKTLAARNVLAREIESSALEWTVLKCKTLTFGSQAPAREAVLLIREDGLPIAEAGVVAKSKVVAADLVLEDVGGPVRDRLVGAQPGDLVGPISTDGGFIVTLVTKRIPPSVDDREIRERARDRVERRTVGAEIEKRVRWHERF
jgi:hypothetical protein